MARGAAVRSERTFAILRKAGHRRSPEPVYHAVTPYCRMALCADEPGPGSAWAEPPGGAVTCPACLRRLGRLAGAGAAVVVIGAGGIGIGGGGPSG